MPTRRGQGRGARTSNAGRALRYSGRSGFKKGRSYRVGAVGMMHTRDAESPTCRYSYYCVTLASKSCRYRYYCVTLWNMRLPARTPSDAAHTCSSSLGSSSAGTAPLPA
eukprot:838181-Prorocentrum_minimum.AAC.1